jgi:hypothetical protein
MMHLPDDDEEFLEGLGVKWELLADGEQAAFLILRGFDVSGGGFTPTSTDLLIRIPPQYPLAPLDMWYCAPSIRLVSTNGYPTAADQFETFLGVSWQRFSRHLAGGSWKPGVDGLRTFFTFIFAELQGKGAK